MLRRREDRRAIALFDRPAVQHHHNPVAHGAHDGKVVADEQQGEAQIGAQFAQQGEDLRLARDIEAGDDLVGDDQPRLQRDGAGDADALALAAGQFVRIALAMDRPQRDALQQGVDLLARPGRRCRAAVQAQRLGNDLGDTAARIERRLRVLEDHLEPGAQRAQPVLRQARDVLPVEQQPARRRCVEAHQGAPEAGLAGAALADDAQRVAGRERQVDAVQDIDRRRGAERRLAAVVRQGQAQSRRLQERGFSHGPPPSHRARRRRPAPLR